MKHCNQLTPMDKPASSTSTIDLVPGSVLLQENMHSRSMFGSPVSVGSTRVQEANDGKTYALFSSLSRDSGCIATYDVRHDAQWKPKEPSCFFGRSTKDVHTWTSLCASLSHFYGVVVMPNRSRISCHSCAKLCMSGSWCMNTRNRNLPKD